MLAVVGMVVAFSLSSTLVKRAESPGVLVAFWRMVAVSLVWNGGLAIGVAQASLLPGRAGILWAPALTALWALGWAITSSIGVDVETQYTVFGSSGAVVVTLATAALPVALNARSAA